jgi:hypothetical protein
MIDGAAFTLATGWIVGDSETAARIARRGPTSASVNWNYRTLFPGTAAPAMRVRAAEADSLPNPPDEH